MCFHIYTKTLLLIYLYELLRRKGTTFKECGNMYLEILNAKCAIIENRAVQKAALNGTRRKRRVICEVTKKTRVSSVFLLHSP